MSLIALGVLLIILGLFFSSVVFWIGVVLLIGGVVVRLLPAGPTTNRRWYW